MAEQLLTAQTSNDSSSWFVCRGPMSTVMAYGTWDGATLTIEVTPDDSTAIAAASDLTFTANGVANLNLAAGVKYRATVSSAGASTSLGCKVYDN